jgi:probable phosphomutase (TIGR03848 family)
MATVVLLRHGRTTANTAGILAGRSAGVHLDELGEQQAARAGERLGPVPLAAVVSSPLERCVETARAVAGRQPARPRVQREKGLAEVDYGVWTGKQLKALAKEQLWRGVQGHPAGVTFPEGESMAGMAARSVAAVRRWDARVEAEHGDEAVWLAVSHGDVIKAVLADALGMHLDVFQRIMVDPASISVVRYTPGRPFVAMMNTSAGDLAHLAPRPKRKGRRRSTPGDAAVGGGAGPGAETPPGGGTAA